MNCTENKSNKRNDISIAKAIGIILMVAGHIFITNETQPLHDFISLVSTKNDKQSL